MQSCSLSSVSSLSHKCSQQIEEVGSSSAISDIILKETANIDLAEGISFSEIDGVDYPRNKMKQKLALPYHRDGHKSEEPKFINKVNLQFICYVSLYKIIILSQ